jgi:hypothetical protein
MISNKKSLVRELVAHEMSGYMTARSRNERATAWRALERAHIISQAYLSSHLAIHWEMLKFTVAERETREIIGQIVRLALAPLGSLTGRIPIGNTGRSNVSAFKPMPVPEDLRSIIENAAE